MADALMTIDVRLFAVLRQRAGRDRFSVSLPVGATAQDALDAAFAQAGEACPLAPEQIALAVNREYAPADTRLADGDEVAVIPPVSGGAADGPRIHADVVDGPIDQAALHARVADRAAGAIVTFSGTPRDVPRLDYEAHVEMARERIAAILDEVAARHGALAIAAQHRVGAVPWPEPAVVVAVSTPHRGEAFAAAREALDRIKAEAPIWKEEVDGDERRRVEGTVPTGAPVAPVGASGEPGERHPGGPLPHLGPDGGATMVDVGGKRVTERRAVAAAMLSMTPATAELVRRGDLPKGDVLGVARIAGITAAKRVPDLVPLAHPLPLTKVDVRAEVVPGRGQVRIEAEARTVGRTGVEIEAMTAALVAAINVYDMVKGVERGIAVGPVTLVAKTGGRTGDFAGPAPWDDGGHGNAGADGPVRDVAASPDAASALGPVPVAYPPIQGATPVDTPATPGAAAPRDARRPLDPPVRAGLLTVSTSRAVDPDPDDPGTVALRALAVALGVDVVTVCRVADDADAIAGELRRLADDEGCDLVLTAGGTGCTVDDVTPEATLAVCDRPVPGIAEALRLASREHTHAWPLSRGVAAIRGRTLVVNLPGSPKAAGEALPVLAPVVDHAVRLLRR
ncbi:MAG: cyclic pyranopterin monophosphate synthase MoaC [Solirubrobacteraceae bacterium]|nr:cyclic pyranopterin monophosphate synthase MoaC [Solirubrobacteraceae bacterium]